MDLKAHNIKILNDNSVERVMRDGTAMGLDRSRLRYVVGYFNESLPTLLAAEPDLKFAVIRLDGDTYQSTLEAIEVLLPLCSNSIRTNVLPTS